jgi:integrin alpha FG-GAP repeat containing protein 1
MFQPYGVSYSGASYKFTVLDTGGVRRATQGKQLFRLIRSVPDYCTIKVGQLPQTAYLSLQAPYTYFGLGRTNNYVENLFVGSTRHQDNHFMTIEGVIPNSQVVIVPYQPQDVDDSSTWTKQLFLMPGRWIPWVGITLITTIVILAITVLFLHLNEKVRSYMVTKRWPYTDCCLFHSAKTSSSAAAGCIL